MFRSVAIALLTVATAPALCAAAGVLDTGFAGSGVQVFTAAGEFTRVVGACPHANGSVSVVAYREEPSEWLIARMRPDGTLDSTYSGDGLATIAMNSRMLDGPDSVTCVGAGNSNPDDDAMLVAATTQVSYLMTRHLMLAMIDLDQGTLDASFGGGTVVRDINALMMGYDPETGETDWVGLKVDGVFPGANGDWLVMGAVHQGSTVSRGFMVRYDAGGTLQAAYPIPEMDGVETLEVFAARTINAIEIRALARVETATGRTWGLLRMAAGALTLSDIVAVGGPEAMGYALQKGRFIANGGFVVPALAPSDAPYGSTPHLLIVRGNQVSDVTLPLPGPLGGETTGSSGRMSATIASNGRVIVGMGLVSASVPVAGYYVAMVNLGDGDGVPDQVDADFGQLGSGVFRYAPPAAQSLCPGNTAPPQHFANLSSWGNATVLVGNAAPRCYDEANNDFGTSTWVLAARIHSDVEALFRNSFE